MQLSTSTPIAIPLQSGDESHISCSPSLSRSPAGVTISVPSNLTEEQLQFVLSKVKKITEKVQNSENSPTPKDPSSPSRAYLKQRRHSGPDIGDTIKQKFVFDSISASGGLGRAKSLESVPKNDLSGMELNEDNVIQSYLQNCSKTFKQLNPNASLQTIDLSWLAKDSSRMVCEGLMKKHNRGELQKFQQLFDGLEQQENFLCLFSEFKIAEDELFQADKKEQIFQFLKLYIHIMREFPCEIPLDLCVFIQESETEPRALKLFLKEKESPEDLYYPLDLLSDAQKKSIQKLELTVKGKRKKYIHPSLFVAMSKFPHLSTLILDDFVIKASRILPSFKQVKNLDIADSEVENVKSFLSKFPSLSKLRVEFTPDFLSYLEDNKIEPPLFSKLDLVMSEPHPDAIQRLIAQIKNSTIEWKQKLTSLFLINRSGTSLDLPVDFFSVLAELPNLRDLAVYGFAVKKVAIDRPLPSVKHAVVPALKGPALLSFHELFPQAKISDLINEFTIIQILEDVLTLDKSHPVVQEVCLACNDWFRVKINQSFRKTSDALVHADLDFWCLDAAWSILQKAISQGIDVGLGNFPHTYFSDFRRSDLLEENKTKRAQIAKFFALSQMSTKAAIAISTDLAILLLEEGVVPSHLRVLFHDEKHADVFLQKMKNLTTEQKAQLQNLEIENQMVRDCVFSTEFYKILSEFPNLHNLSIGEGMTIPLSETAILKQVKEASFNLKAIPFSTFNQMFPGLTSLNLRLSRALSEEELQAVCVLPQLETLSMVQQANYAKQNFYAIPLSQIHQVGDQLKQIKISANPTEFSHSDPLINSDLFSNCATFVSNYPHMKVLLSDLNAKSTLPLCEQIAKEKSITIKNLGYYYQKEDGGARHFSAFPFSLNFSYNEVIANPHLVVL